MFQNTLFILQFQLSFPKIDFSNPRKGRKQSKEKAWGLAAEMIKGKKLLLIV